jgi:glycosyltransferase involved in cell wall biosynthesis
MKLVIQNGSRVWGGNEKWLATLAAGLVARGHTVVVSCPRGAVRDRLGEMGIATTGVRPRGVLDVVTGLGFALWLRRERPDALLLTSWRPLAWGAWAGRRARIPRVVVRLGIVREHPRRGGRARAFRRWVDAMIVNSSEIRDVWLRSAADYPAGRVHVVMNGIRARDAGRPALRERLRAELGTSPGTLLIGGAGHLAPRKGFDLLLRAFAEAALPDARVVIAGGGDYLAELRAMADELGISGRVHFLGHRDDGPDVIAGCDVFVLGSRNEGMANVMLEAMVAGVPVVATDVSGVRRALAAEPGTAPAGWIVPPDHPAAMADALRDVAQALAAEAAHVGGRTAEALRRIRERFGVERMVAECEAILFGASASPPGGE